MKTILHKYIDEFAGGRDLAADDSESMLDALIGETDESLMAELFQAWNRKGVAEDEIYSIAKIMRERCTKIRTKHERFVDVVGTGGSRSKTFNVSTAAAFVVAGAGVPVAKHGNKAATSNSGSADVLAELGVEPAVDAETAERCLNEIGICFMFAPNFHRLSPTLGKVRRGLGFPTVFNCVGPLCNPASAPHQLIGVWSEEMVPKMANALARLGTKKSWVVHGRDGLDEISLSGQTHVAEVDGDTITTFEIEPGDFGCQTQPLDGIRVSSAAESARVIRSVLMSSLEPGSDGKPEENVVIMNAAAAFYISGYGDDLIDGTWFAADSIKNGHAMRKLNQLTEAVKA